MLNPAKIKVLYLVTKSNWGGAQRYVYDLATHLGSGTPSAEAVVACGGEGLLVRKLGEKKIRVIPLPDAQRDIAIFKEIKLLIQLFKIVKSEKPDVLHVNSSKLAGLGAFIGFVTRTRTIFTVHGWPFNEDRPWWQRLLIYKFSWLTSFFSDITITITQSDFAQGKRMPFVGHKMRMIHNAIEQIDFYSRDEARKKLGLDESDFVVGSIGELHKNKGFIYLAKAAEHLPNAKFVIMGEGEERNSLDKTKLRLLGQVPDASRYLKAFDIFVLPSLKEGLPYVLLEASQARLPVVASNVGGIIDIVGNAGFLPWPKNSKDLIYFIKQFTKNNQLRLDLGLKLQNRLIEKFSFDKFLKETYKLYTR